jgi:hypothetical protein
MNTIMNTGAASLSDERERAAITACALMIKGICLTRPNAEWTGAIEDRIQFMLKQMQAGAAIAAGGAQEAVRLTADDADMFWPELDGEQMYHSLDDAVTAVFDDCGADAGDTFTFTCAARLPKVTVQIIEVTENGFEWEEIDLAKEPK